MNSKSIQTRHYGRTGRKVTMVGLGGEGILRTHGQTDQACVVIQEALAQGLTYFDSARVYADSELYYGTLWRKYPETRARIFQASKSASRSKAGALADLAETLSCLATDYLDLWQIHDVRTEDDLKMIAQRGGALEAFAEAKSSGKVRFIGVTGHHDPQILTKAIDNWPVDAVMMPVNPVEAVIGGFLTSTLPAAKAKGIAVIAMKILGASRYINSNSGISAELLIRYALSHDVSVAIVGCSAPKEVKNLAAAGRIAKPLTQQEKAIIFQVFEPHALRLAYYRGQIEKG
jgi:aryl-alcohol dehydrogenase-like predicted oxidoreductase